MSDFRILAAAIVLGLTLPAAALVVDHDDVDGVVSLPQTTMDAIGQQKWFFSHASVGGNMISGLSDLHATSPTRYQLAVASVGYNSSLQRANNPPTPTAAGTVYECNRGNPGWQSKINIFDSSVRLGGWHETAVNAAMDKFCYIDQTASATAYLNAMTALETAYPSTVFVYTTMPLMTSTDSDNVLRNQYNAAVRSFCVANDKLLFDIADMEAYDPSGTASTFTSGGVTYQRLYSGYSSDGGHLNTAGCRRIAAGWYAVAAVIASPHAPGDLNGDGYVNEADFLLFSGCGTGSKTPHNGSLTCQAADFDHDTDVDMDDFGVFERCVRGAASADPTCAP